MTVVAALLLGAPAEAAAGTAFDRVFKDYVGDAQISPCRHSLRDLRKAQRQVPDDVVEFTEFPEAVREAISFRKRHGCSRGKH